MKKNQELYNLLNNDLYDLDEEVISKALSRYETEEIFSYLINKLEKSIEFVNAFDDPWKIGRIFGDIDIRLDDRIMKNLSNYSSELKIASFNFLSGYWDTSEPDLKNYKIFLNYVYTSINSKWENKISEAAIDAVAISYGNNKDLCNGKEIKEIINKFKDFAKNNDLNPQVKSLILRV
jgi:hypothetical protein